MTYMADIDKTCLERVISAALAVYRTADSLPSGDPVVYGIKKAALQTTEKFVVFLSSEEPQKTQAEPRQAALQSVEVLCGYFEIAKAQKWIDERNFLVLAQEYRDLYVQIALTKRDTVLSKGKAVAEEKKPEIRARKEAFSPESPVNERQQKILEYMTNNEESPFSPIAALFIQVSKRTVRRDLDSLVQRNILAREGNTSSSLYRLIRTA